LLDDAEAGAELRQDIATLSRIISQLLQLNEIDGLAGNAEAATDLTVVTKAVRDELASLAGTAKVTIELTIPPASVLVKGDDEIIGVAVRNLIENAIDQTPPGAAVELRVEAPGRLAVIDRGPGIADDLRDKIFEPFWSSDPDSGHAGLGLTIVH